MKSYFTRRQFLLKTSMAAVVAMTPFSLSGNTGEARVNSRCRMKVGSDTDKIPFEIKKKGAIAVLDYVKEQGFDGAFFRLVLDLSPTLDHGELREVRQYADSLGLFLEAGVGWVNPYNTAETPDIRRLGNGDYLLAMQEMLKAARIINCTELWTVSAHSIHGNPFYVAYDRFRTDVSWNDQLEAIYKFIYKLSPMLKDLGLRLNIETHGDETSFEAIRLIERLGPEILGVTLDTGNLPLQADCPLPAIKRLAPYVHLTHCKDGILFRTSEGLNQQMRSLGEGVIDWYSALKVLNDYNPDLHLCIEDYRAENLLLWSTPKYRDHYPDLTDTEVLEFEKLTDSCEEQIRVGAMLGVEDFKKIKFGEPERVDSYKNGAEYLRKVISRLNSK